MTIPAVSAPYQPTVGAFAQFLRRYHGQEPSTPAKVAALILSLPGRDDAPLRLLVGPDAVDYAGRAAAALTESDERWLHLSLSTAA